MMKESSNPRERGIALLVALFTLVLLSVIGLGMMYSTNMETAINANYRDKQLAIYAARAGIQEVRDRIQPATLNIVPPADVPSLTAKNVIYLINPKSGETVAPWDLTTKWGDTELCQERTLGLSGSLGVPCTTIPSGSNWYSVVDDSLSTSADSSLYSAMPWHSLSSSGPLDFKWARISLKANNMTPLAVNGDTSDATQACWDGSHQVLRPSGYGTTCQPDGSIVSYNPANYGSGYTSTGPTVTIGAPPAGGVQATATPIMTQFTTGQVQSVDLTAAGSGYTSAPAVTITGDGTGATATATIVAPGSSVTSVTLGSAGTQCYGAVPTVSITGGGGSGAAATAVLDTTKSCVSSWTVSGSCNARKGTSASGVGLSGASGSGFSGTIVFSNGTGNVSSATIQQPGSGYTSNPTNITNLTSPSCGSLTVTANAGYHVASLTLTSGGSGYTSAPTVTLQTGSGTAATAATATATIGPPAANVGQVVGLTLTNSGSGYTTAPTVTFSGGGGAGAAATATLGFTYKVTGLNFTNPGKGYRNGPAVTFTGGGGSGAAGTTTVSHGTDYGRVYMVTALGQTRSGARAMAQVELATPVLGFNVGGALTMDGPNPNMLGMPNSNGFVIQGTDANSCGGTPDADHPAIGGYDDPNADPPTHSMDQIVAALPRPDHYTGAGGTPSVQNIYGTMGDTMTTPDGLQSLTDSLKACTVATGCFTDANVYGNNPGSINLGTSANKIVDYVDGNLTLNGNNTGYGILVVNGTLNFGGDFSWYGTILVVGDGVINFNGGGNGEIHGTLLAAKIWDNFTNKNLLDTLGSPTENWSGGGTNNIYYDHCLAGALISMVPFTPPASTRPMRVLSFRMLP